MTPGARIILLCRDKVLAINESERKSGNRLGWNVPGGSIEDGEYPIQAALREFLEETGLDLEASSLTGPVLVEGLQYYFLSYCLVPLTPTSSIEGEVAWIDIKTLLDEGHWMKDLNRTALEQFGVL